jgi:Tol biopolymer transport system component/DNA-binding winged helix-turn-helix (wHTH) protein
MPPFSRPVLRFGDFSLDPAERHLLYRGQSVPLTPKVFDTLLLLVRNAGHLVEKEAFLKQIWPDAFVEESSLAQNISVLRKVLGDDGNGNRFIETVPKRGYRFLAEVQEVSHETTSAATERETSEPTEPLPFSLTLTGKRSQSVSYLFAVMIVLGCAAGAAWLYFGRSVESELPPATVVPVTSLPDRAEDASLSPDGNELAFSRGSDVPNVSGIYVKQIGSEQQLQLTKSDHDGAPAWSPDGRYIAFSRYEDGHHEIFKISAIGGAEHKLYSGEPAHPPLSWTRDGKFIAFSAKEPNQNTYSINLLSIDNLETRRVTEPTSEQQDWGPAFSPNGEELAFIRTNGSLNIADIFVVSIKGGEPRRLTFDNTDILSPAAWTRDGTALIFSSPRRSIPTLWRIPVSGGIPIQVPQVGVVTRHPSVSESGHRLAYDQITGSSSIWSVDLANLTKKDSRLQVTASGGRNWAPQFSPDGQRVLFLSDRLGSLELWVSKKDGSELTRLTNLGTPTATGPPRWSLDGQRIAFDSALGEHNAIFVMKAEGGVPRPLIRDASDNVNASWSHDGKWIYFTSNRGGQWQIWKMTSEGSQPLQLTRQGGFVAFESRDGKYVYYAKTPSSPDIWRVRSSGGDEIPVSPRIHVQQWRDWALVDDGIFFCPERSVRNSSVKFLRFSSGNIADITRLEKPGEWISASANGRFVLYNQSDRWESNIMLLENFQ